VSTHGTVTGQRLAETHRIIKPGDKGPDVQALKRALSKAGLCPWPGDHPDPNYGPNAQDAVKQFQEEHSLEIDGEVGKDTLTALLPFFDRFGLHLLAQAEGGGGATGKRRTIVATALLAYNKREQIHYTMGPQRMEGVVHQIRPPHVPAYGDCSSMVTWYYWVAGAPDPNGANYNGTGYTGTLGQHGTAVSVEHSQPGDYVLYGSGPPWHHVALFVGVKDGKHMVVSHGSEPGPYYLPYNYRGDVGEIRSAL
jgi:Putative peptidoglycan binding domain